MEYTSFAFKSLGSYMNCTKVEPRHETRAYMVGSCSSMLKWRLPLYCSLLKNTGMRYNHAWLPILQKWAPLRLCYTEIDRFSWSYLVGLWEAYGWNVGTLKLLLRTTTSARPLLSGLLTFKSVQGKIDCTDAKGYDIFFGMMADPEVTKPSIFRWGEGTTNDHVLEN